MFLVLLVLALGLLLAPPPTKAQAATVWKTANQITVAWDAITTLDDGSPLPTGTTMQYQLYTRTDPSGPPVANGNAVTATQATVTFTTEGQFDIGLKAQRMVNAQVVAESIIVWSNDPAVVQGGNTFGDIYFRAPAAPKNMRQP